VRSAILLLLVVTGCAATTALPQPRTRTGMYTVRGRIVDAATNEPIVGATAVVTTSPPAPTFDPRAATLADEHGVYQIDLVARPVRVDIYYGDATWTRPVEHTANGRDYVVATIALDVAAADAAVAASDDTWKPDPGYVCTVSDDYTKNIPVSGPVDRAVGGILVGNVVCVPSLGGLHTTCAIPSADSFFARHPDAP